MTAPPFDPDPGDMALRAVPGPDCCTVTVTGDVDARSGPVLADRLLDALDRSDVPTLELDLRGVTFLDSAGLTALVVVHRAATRTGRVFRLRCGTTREVLRPLEITGLSTLIPLVEG